MSAKDRAIGVALAYGWHVFRLRIGHNEDACDGGTASCKTIKVLGGQWAPSNDPDVIEGWDWSAANGYGIATGPSGLFVCDVDPGGTWDDDGTRTHLTGRGTHYVYQDHIGLPSGTSVWPGVDTRGVGGMIVGPGSWHPHGAYEVGRDVSPLPLPKHVIEKVGRRVEAAAQPYTGPAYADLSDDMQKQADALVEVTLFDWSVSLAQASTWDDADPEAGPGKRGRDHLGRGWERMAADFAMDLMRLALAPWTSLELDEAEEHYRRLLPDVIAANDKCKRKWTAGRLARASALPLDPPWSAESIFDETPVLQHIRRAAHARAIPAENVLLNVITRVLLYVPSEVTLPPTAGSRKSLNCGTIVVGSAGAAKSSAEAVAAEVLGRPDPDGWVLGLGSGEGMIDAFYERVQVPNPNTGKLIWDTRLVEPWERARLFSVDEGEVLMRLMERSGQTIGVTLRSALTGERLSTSLSKAGNAHQRHLPAGSYRLNMHVNLHPSQAGILLGTGNEDVGLPQRFIWAEADVAALPDRVEDLPAWPGSLDWDLPAELPLGDIEYPESIAAQIRQDRLDSAKGKIDARRAHANLTRLKAAFALALLHGEATITERWWSLAGLLLEKSFEIQDRLTGEMVEQVQKEATRREVRRARAEDAAQDDRFDRALWSMLEKVRLRPVGEEVPWHVVRPSRSMRDAGTKEELLAAVAEVPGFKVVTGENANGGEAAFIVRAV